MILSQYTDSLVETIKFFKENTIVISFFIYFLCAVIRHIRHVFLLVKYLESQLAGLHSRYVSDF